MVRSPGLSDAHLSASLCPLLDLRSMLQQLDIRFLPCAGVDGDLSGDDDDDDEHALPSIVRSGVCDVGGDGDGGETLRPQDDPRSRSRSTK